MIGSLGISCERCLTNSSMVSGSLVWNIRVLGVTVDCAVLSGCFHAEDCLVGGDGIVIAEGGIVTEDEIMEKGG